MKELYNNVESITLSSGLGLSRYLKVGESLNSRYALLSDGIIRTEEQLKEYRKLKVRPNWEMKCIRTWMVIIR